MLAGSAAGPERVFMAQSAVDDFQLSVVDLVIHSTPISKAVLLILLIFSILSWAIMLNKLIVYIEDGRLRPDNNRVENAIRPFVVGRKNWLFAGSPDGARASATFFSLIETARANGLEPYDYLRASVRKAARHTVRTGFKNPAASKYRSRFHCHRSLRLTA